MRQTLFRILLRAAAVVVVCVVAVSCFNDDYGLCPTDDVPADEVRVVFTLAMSDPTTRANTNWSEYDPDSIGTVYENRINPDNIDIRIYSADGKNLLGSVEDLMVYKNDNDEYRVVGSIPVTNTDLVGKEIKNAKVMIMANCNQTGDNIGDWTFSEGNITDYIPMWGVKTTTLNLKGGEQTDLGQIDLLRAVAKVEVALSDDVEGYKLKSVSISRHNTQGYCLPGDYNTVANTTALTFARTLRIPDNVATATALDFTDKQPLYLPEYENTSAADAAVINVTVTNTATGNDEQYILRFVDYNDGAPGTTYRNIVRNHWYRYILYKGGNSLKVQLNVRPWAKYNTDIVM